MASGSDDLLTIHSNNTTERLRVNNSGDVIVGSGVTLSPDGDVFFTGIATGNGSGLTALNASNISSGTVPTARLGSGTASSSTFLRGDSTFQTVNTDLVSDTSPQLGGDLDTNSFHILMDDSHPIKFGNGTELEIMHTGSSGFGHFHNSQGNFVIDTTGNFYVRNSDGTKTSILATPSGATELYHDNTKQCETTANGLAFPSGKGIDFSANGDGSRTVTTNGNLFDDYEEGEWTPTVSGSSSAGSATYISRTGHYIRIGRLVHIYADVRWSAHSGSGGLEVHGLPFAVNSAGYTNHFGIGYNNGHSHNNNHTYGWANNNGEYIRYWETNSGGGSGSLSLDTVVAEIHFYGHYITNS